MLLTCEKDTVANSCSLEHGSPARAADPIEQLAHRFGDHLLTDSLLYPIMLKHVAMVPHGERVFVRFESNGLNARQRLEALLCTPHADSRARETGDVNVHFPSGRRLQTCATGFVAQGFIASSYDVGIDEEVQQSWHRSPLLVSFNSQVLW